MENSPENVPVPVLENNKKHFLFEVTTFSKIMATIVFITLPFVGFYIGTEFTSQQPVIFQTENTQDRENESSQLSLPLLTSTISKKTGLKGILALTSDMDLKYSTEPQCDFVQMKMNYEIQLGDGTVFPADCYGQISDKKFFTKDAFPIKYVSDGEVIAELSLSNETVTTLDSNKTDNADMPLSQPKLFQIGTLFETVNDTEQSASVVYDKNLRKLVTNSNVTDNYFSQTFADTLATSLPDNSTFVVNIPQESVIFDQQLSDDGTKIYASLLRTDKRRDYEKTKPETEMLYNDKAMALLVYDIAYKKVTFKMSSPSYSRIHSISGSGDLIAVTSFDCYPCGSGGALPYYVVDIKTGTTPRYKTLGQLYSFKFIGERTYTYTTSSYEGCDGMGCVNPGETFTESF